MQKFQDRIAVVTGAGSGIGRATSEALAARGCHLALVDIDPGAMAETARRIEARGRRVSQHVVDVADRAAMAALPGAVMERHGAVHILVNNAGVSVGKSFADHTLEDLDWILGINLWGVIHGCKFFLPLLLGQDEAHIVNISSVFGIIAVPNQSSYCTSKFGVRGLTESLEAELRNTPVGVTSVHPGAIQTGIVQASRIDDEGMRTRAQELFDKSGSPPELVARHILAAIEGRRLRAVVTREAKFADWAKRLFPVATQRVIARGAARLTGEPVQGPGR